ncbi:MAG: hypothetical protein MJ072_05610, partial [Clostridia bacterium]|nr:hypothetical protein [Clostridia bacterium]
PYSGNGYGNNNGGYNNGSQGTQVPDPFSEFSDRNDTGNNDDPFSNMNSGNTNNNDSDDLF